MVRPAAVQGMRSRYVRMLEAQLEREPGGIGKGDPTSRAIWAQKFLAKKRRAARPPMLPHRCWPPVVR